MNDPRNDELLKRVRAELDREANTLDELTVARLRAARRRALDTRPHRLGWLATGKGLAIAGGGVAITAVTAGLVAMLWLTPAALPPANGISELELLAEADLDVYDNLEFYRWLAEQQRAG